MWHNDEESNSIQQRGDAQIIAGGEMAIGNGAFVADGINEKLLKLQIILVKSFLRKSGRFFLIKGDCQKS